MAGAKLAPERSTTAPPMSYTCLVTIPTDLEPSRLTIFFRVEFAPSVTRTLNAWNSGPYVLSLKCTDTPGAGSLG